MTRHNNKGINGKDKLTRREFLKNAVLAISSFGLSSLGVANTRSPAETATNADAATDVIAATPATELSAEC